jgi:uncharacterized protein YkwD
MAGFEGTRVSPLSEAVREWKLGRFAPLYAAGIAAGVGFGVAFAMLPGGADSKVEQHRAVISQPVVDEAPAFVLPDGLVATFKAPSLPVEMDRVYDAMAWEAPVLEPSTAETPVVQSNAPAAPAAVQPVAQAPKPAPAAQPAPAQPAPAAPPAPVAEAAPPAPVGRQNFYVPEVSGGGATTLELNLLALINAERANAGLAPYRLEGGLTKIARTRSQQLIDQNYFAHRDPFGYSMYVELLAYFGYTSYAWAGENLAMNNWPAETAANEAMRGLMNSPTHRANILAGDFSRIGVGEVTVADGRHFFTMIFLS